MKLALDSFDPLKSLTEKLSDDFFKHNETKTRIGLGLMGLLITASVSLYKLFKIHGTCLRTENFLVKRAGVKDYHSLIARTRLARIDIVTREKLEELSAGMQLLDNNGGGPGGGGGAGGPDGGGN